MAVSVIQLRRMENSQPWGFRLKGGSDQGIQLHVEHVQPKGRAASSGLQVGDLVVAIGGVSTHNMSHGQVKSEMLRAGNDLDLTIQRDGSLVSSQPQVQAQAQAAAAPESEPRVQIDEQPICKFGGPTYKTVVPKTYQVLEGQLGATEEETGEPIVKPSSIFDRKKAERSDYLKAKGTTIQKAFGE